MPVLSRVIQTIGLTITLIKHVITITALFITDAEPPMIFNTPSSQNVNTDADSETATVLWIPPVASDNSGKAVTLTSNLKPGDSFNIGNTTVVYTAVDAFGNTAIYAFGVVVRGKFVYNFSHGHKPFVF